MNLPNNTAKLICISVDQLGNTQVLHIDTPVPSIVRSQDELQAVADLLDSGSLQLEKFYGEHMQHLLKTGQEVAHSEITQEAANEPSSSKKKKNSSQKCKLSRHS